MTAVMPYIGEKRYAIVRAIQSGLRLAPTFPPSGCTLLLPEISGIQGVAICLEEQHCE